MQRIEIIGNLGRDPEMRFTAEGVAVCDFSIATNRKWTGKDGEKHEQVTWFRVSAWRGLAEVCNQYLSKGRQVFVAGHLNSDDQGGPRIWQGNDGESRASFEIQAEQVEFLGGGKGADEGVEPNGPSDEPVKEEDEIPF